MKKDRNESYNSGDEVNGKYSLIDMSDKNYYASDIRNDKKINNNIKEPSNKPDKPFSNI